MALANVNVRIGADLSQFRTSLQNATKQMGDMGKRMQTLGKNMSMYVTAPLAGLAAVSVAAFDTQIKAETKLRTALKGNTEAFKALTAEASRLQGLTLFGDEETIKAQALVAAFVKEADQIKTLMPLIQDLATAKDMDLSSAADLVTKTFASSTNAMARYGIQVEGAAGSNERLTSITNALTEAFGGQAKAAAQVGTGPMVQLKNAVGDLFESFGKIITEAINPFINKLRGMVEGFQKISEGTQKTIVVVSALAAAIGPLLAGLGFMMTTVVPGLITAVVKLRAVMITLNAAMAANPAGAIAIALAAATAAFIAYKVATRDAGEVTDETTEKIKSESEELDKLFYIAKNAAEGSKARADAIAQINTKYKDYLPNLISEKSSLNELEKAQAAVNEQLIKHIMIKSQEVKIQEAAAKIAKMELENLEFKRQLSKEESNYADQLGTRQKNMETLSRSIELNNAVIASEKQALKELTTVYDDLSKGLIIVDNQVKKVTDSSNILAEAINSGPLQKMPLAMQAVTTSAMEVGETVPLALKPAVDGINSFAAATEDYTQQVITSNAENATSFKDFAGNVIQSVKSIVSAKLAEALASVIAASSSLGPAAPFVAAASVAAMKALFSAIPAFAGGVENFSGGMALVGEKGPELVNLPGGSDVIPNNMMGMMGGGTIHLQGQFRIQGRDLIYVIDQTERLSGRRT